MKCSVANCFNSKVNDNGDIVFYPLPKERSLRKKWLNVVGGKNVRCKMYVCSEHFNSSDFVDSGQLKTCAVPSLIQVCRICLVSDTLLYEISERGVIDTYEEVTGLKVSPDDGFPQKLCWECCHRLLSCSRLRDKAVRSQALMEDALNAEGYLTTDIINTIDRQSNNLTSTLTSKHFEVDYSDLYLYENMESTEGSEHETYKEIDTVDDAVKETEFICYDETSSDEEIEVKKRSKSKKQKEKVDRRKKPVRELLNEDIFDINELTMGEQLFDVESRQASSNFKNADYKCMECFKGFHDKDAFKSHMTRHTDVCGKVACKICNLHFKTRHALVGHMAQTHMYKFTCKQCTYVTTRRYAAKLHEKYHNGTRYLCPHCPQVFLKLTTYMGHIRIKHASDFVCELCGYTFVSEKGIDVHKKKKHRLDDKNAPLEGPYCDVCDVTFISEEAHERHLKLSSRHSSENDPNRIRNDPQTKSKERNGRGKRKVERRPVIHPRDPTDRERQMDAIGPVTCEQCGVELPDLRLYAQHFRAAHPDKNRTKYSAIKTPCMCEQCGKIFQSMALLKDHMWVHTGEKRFKCDLCDKSFSQKTNLVFHMRVHNGTRPSYECPICGKHFAFFNNRRRHMFIHTGLRPFKCDTCNKRFTTSGERRAHVEHVHLKKPWPKRVRGRHAQQSEGDQESDLQDMED